VFVVLAQNQRTFVERVDFINTAGYLAGGDAREQAGFRGRGPTRVITDMGVLEPDPATRELMLTAVHAGVEVADVRAATGWPLRVASPLAVTDPPTAHELAVLRDLRALTALAHRGP
jgi:glutaconate CoA-transferase subunit B